MTIRALYETKHDEAIRYATKIARSVFDAEDAVQNAFVDLLAKGPDATAALLFHVVRQRTLDTTRRKRLILVAKLHEEAIAPGRGAELTAEATRACTVLTGAREFDAWILWRSGCSNKQITEILQISPHYTAVLLSAVRKKLKPRKRVRHRK